MWCSAVRREPQVSEASEASDKSAQMGDVAAQRTVKTLRLVLSSWRRLVDEPAAGAPDEAPDEEEDAPAAGPPALGRQLTASAAPVMKLARMATEFRQIAPVF